MSESPVVSMMHTGLCVSDLAKSKAFYSEALGFTADVSMEGLGEPLDQLLELPGQTVDVCQLHNNGMRIELVTSSGGVTGPAERRPMNQRGITHMTFTVTDIEAVMAAVKEYGGQVHMETWIDSAFGKIVFCTDPDGTRIELMQAPG
ncbi:VOC family protein [Mangrovimicrobium sediminis]|uniref:VOC family protein n=1 Tax=Mangrovimicrobium sediminis TaxID=2562682 RepID=A0A4Z0LYE8_9GAMM|nr:VOC family protein [Haliea sp. SAOS-164]TGD72309.1 VOC family protein [Haliea sp. SAOS-164]